MTHTFNLSSLRARIFRIASRIRPLPAITAASGLCLLSSCSMFAYTENSDTDTVPLLDGEQSDTAFDSDGEGSASKLVNTEKGNNDSPDRTPAEILATGGSPTHPELITFRPKTNSTADAWAAPILSNPSPASSSRPDTTVMVPLPPAISPSEEQPTLLTLNEFREKVFTVQQKEETQRFREAIGIPSKSSDDETGSTGSAPTEIFIPDGPASVESQKVKAAYQVYRWNLMETLAGAERAYWRLHFAEQQFKEIEKSVGTLAAINDKARIGVLRKTRESSDIAATETMRGHRKIAAAEAAAMRTAAMAEAVSYLHSDADPNTVSIAPTKIRTEAPSDSSPPPEGISMVGRAQKTHPLYLGELMRVKGTPEAEEEVKILDSRLEERITASLEKVRANHLKLAKTASVAATYRAGLEENLRSFSAGKITLAAISAYEKGLLASGQAHIDAGWEYQSASIDYELEVGDFLEKRSQETPLSTLIAR